MSAQIIQFRKYQKSREFARMHGDVERSLAKLSELAAQVFSALQSDAAAGVSGASARQQAYSVEPRIDHSPHREVGAGCGRSLFTQSDMSTPAPEAG